MEKELDRRFEALYPEKGLNAPIKDFCKNNPKIKEVLNDEQVKFYCRIHPEFRTCYTKDVLYNFDTNRPQKITMARDCLKETEGMTNLFDENAEQLQDLTTVKNFEEVFLQVMLPEEPTEEPTSPSQQDSPQIYQIAGKLREGPPKYSPNNRAKAEQKLQYVESALDQVNKEALELKEYPKPIYRQYPKAFANEILLLDTMPPLTDAQERIQDFQYPKEHCLSRPQSAADCRALIDENERRRRAEALEKIPLNPDRIRFPEKLNVKPETAQ